MCIRRKTPVAKLGNVSWQRDVHDFGCDSPSLFLTKSTGYNLCPARKYKGEKRPNPKFTAAYKL